MSGHRTFRVGETTYIEYANVPFAIRRINSDKKELLVNIPEEVARAMLDPGPPEKRLFRLRMMLWVDEDRLDDARKAIPLAEPKPDSQNGRYAIELPVNVQIRVTADNAWLLFAPGEQVSDDRTKALAWSDFKGSGFKSAETALSSARGFIAKCLKRYPSAKAPRAQR